MSKDLNILKKKVQHLRKLKANQQKKVDKFSEGIEALLDTCPHEEIVEESSYYPGGYLDTSYVMLWNKCTFCGKTSEPVRDKNHHGTYS